MISEMGGDAGVKRPVASFATTVTVYCVCVGEWQGRAYGVCVFGGEGGGGGAWPRACVCGRKEPKAQGLGTIHVAVMARPVGGDRVTM